MNDVDDDGTDDRVFDAVLREALGDDDAAATAQRLLAADPSARRAAAQRAERAAGVHRGASTFGRRNVLVAALLLLGAFVVTGVLYLQKHDPQRAQRWVQDPKTEKVITPRDLPQFLELLSQARAIRLEHRDVTGATFVDNAAGSYDRLDTKAWPEMLDVDGDRLAALQAGIQASRNDTVDHNSIEGVLVARFGLPDGATMIAWLHVGTGVVVDPGIVNCKMLRGTPELATLVRGLQGELDRMHDAAAGIAETISDLDALPPTSTQVQCPPMPDLLAHLRRFPLQSLTLHVPFRSLQLNSAARVTRELLQDLQQLPDLLALDIDADTLTDADLEATIWPNLQRLCLRRGGRELAATGLAKAFPALQVLSFRSCLGLTAAGLTAIGRNPHLSSLQLIDCYLGDDQVLLQSIGDFVAMRTLALRSGSLGGEHLTPLLRTKLQRLVLVDTNVTGEQLAPFAQLPSLRELDLVTPTIGDDACEGLATMRQLRHLRLMNVKLTTDGWADLKSRMPDCSIEGTPGSRLFDTKLWLTDR